MQNLFQNLQNVEINNKIEENFKKFEHVVFDLEKNDPNYVKEFLIEISQGLTLSVKKDKIKLPETDKKKKKTLFLDLDETIVHLERDNINNLSFLNFRPYTEYFLEEISQIYEIFIFTAASNSYANKVVDEIDPEGKFIDGILSRNNCTKTKYGLLLKDLNSIKNRELSQMVLVDNNSFTFGNCIENGIPILKYEGNKNDKELLFLTKFLKEISDEKDLRICLENRYNLRKIIDSILNGS